MPTVLHVLPHRGGGGERYIELLGSMDGYVHQTTCFSASRRPITGAASIARRWPAVARAARSHDLVHLHGDVAAILGLPLMRRRPAVVTTHGLSFLRRAHGLPLRVAQGRWRRVALAARRIICTSEAERAELQSLLSVPDERLTVIRNGIPLVEPPSEEQRRRARAALGIERREVVCLYVGLLDRYKDPLTAVRAVEAARERGAAVMLLVAGDGPLLAQVRAQAGPAVRVLGFREHPSSLFAAADVFVMPSTREGSSYALLEAMGHGLAIVASDGPGVAEAVGLAGIVARAGDVEAFAAAVSELAAEPARRSQLGSAARARASECFAVERFVSNTRAVYALALASSSPMLAPE